ncbi:MFS transporter [Bacillus sp. 03113]|uniref:MFS transporter n=1 Tax=Bacillus sp. 03113 TaxID=2578211 RepID=UPI0015E8D457|nr:MFS transporter [Bacillus sp. 03113]
MADSQTRIIESEHGFNRPIPEWKFSFIAWLFAFCAVFIISNVYTMIPIITDVSQALHVSTSAAFWASSIFAIFYAFGFLVFGPLSDKLGRKQVIVYGLLFLTITTFSIGFVHNIVIIIVLRAIQGFFAATFQPVALAYVFETYPSEKKGTTISIISTGFLIAAIVGQLISSWVTRHFGWSNVFIVFGIIYLLALIVVWKILPYTKKQKKNMHLLAAWKQMFRLLLNPKLVGAYFITFTLCLSFVGMCASMGNYLIETYRLSAHQVFQIRCLGVIGMTLSLLTGKLIAQFGLKSVLVGGLITAAGGMLLESMMSNVNLIAIFSVVFVAGLSISISTLIQVVGILGDQAKSSAAVLYALLLNLGASAGPLILNFGDFRIVTLILAGILTVSMIISGTLKISGEQIKSN